MKQINNTTFISDNLGELKPLVTIGGKPIDKFIPNLNMSFHNDEFFINLNRRDKQSINTTDKAEIDGTDKDIFYIDENGRFKWDIEFKERPSTNSWTWELKHTDGVEFYYQGELTAEEIADGCERPLEVVGSYAVYCNKANNKYKTGKLCHIYRPFCYDINGESIYADLLIADGQLTIAIDETWLDNAVYPVRLDPTFGYASVGASNIGSAQDTTWGTRFTPASSGTVQAISAYVNTSGDGSRTWKYALYQYGTPSCTLLSGTELGSGNVVGWSTLNLSSEQAINAQEYVLALQASFYVVYFYYDSGGFSGQEGYAAHNYPDDWDSSETFNFATDLRFSIYATYTESGGSSLPTIINNYRQQGVM